MDISKIQTCVTDEKLCLHIWWVAANIVNK